MNKRAQLAGASMLGIVVASGEAQASLFTMKGTFTAPVSGVFEIVADGAQCGAGFFNVGGLGGEATGEFTLTAGETLNVVVGAVGAKSVGAPMGAGTGASGAAPPPSPSVRSGWVFLSSLVVVVVVAAPSPTLAVPAAGVREFLAAVLAAGRKVWPEGEVTETTAHSPGVPRGQPGPAAGEGKQQEAPPYTARVLLMVAAGAGGIPPGRLDLPPQTREPRALG